MFLLTCPGLSAAASFFRPLGALEPTAGGTVVRGVSNGGAVVVGSAGGLGLGDAFRWTQSGGLVKIVEGIGTSGCVLGGV